MKHYSRLLNPCDSHFEPYVVYSIIKYTEAKCRPGLSCRFQICSITHNFITHAEPKKRDCCHWQQQVILNTAVQSGSRDELNESCRILGVTAWWSGRRYRRHDSLDSSDDVKRAGKTDRARRPVCCASRQSTDLMGL